MKEIQASQEIRREKFNYLWDRFRNGYEPSVYNPEEVVGCNGRRNSLVLSIPINQPEIIQGIQLITDQIRCIPGVYIMPPEYYHITVKRLGFLTTQKQCDYDIEPQTLEQIIEQSGEIFSQIPKFSIRLKSVNGLASFVIVEVEDNGAIAQIQGRFHEDATLVPSYSIEGEDWLPHLSIVRLKNLKGLNALKSEMDRLRRIDIGEIQVTHINLSQAILQKPCPRFQILRDLPFSSQRLIPSPD
jgi:2'-5' RNA ligase